MSDSITSLDWIRKAEEHEKNARALLKHKDGTAWASAFFAQQMTELILKGLLIVHEIEPPKTHDLMKLVTLLAKEEPKIESYLKDFRFLNEYYVEDRYPGDYPEITWPEAEQALEAALRIKEFVLSKIK